MRTDTNVADGDTPPASAAMNKQLHPNLFVFDRDRTADGLLFATGGDRCRYLGKSSREKPDWLKQNEGRYRRIEDVLRKDDPGTPSVETEIKLDAGPAEPTDSSSSPEVRNDGNDKDDVTSADALLGDRAHQCKPISPPTPVKESAEKQKPPAGISKSTPKLSLKIMRTVLNSLRERPILYQAADAAGIHRKTLEYRIRRSEAGEGYDIRWQGITRRFHEHCEWAIDEAHQKLEDEWLRRAIDGYEKVLTHRGRVVYKIDQELVGLGFQGPDAYLRDENGKPVPETVHKEDTKAKLHVLKRRHPDTWGKHPKRNAPREGGVLVLGDVTKKPKYNTDKSVRARRWKADLRRIREEKD